MEMIVYLADMIEPGRDFQGVDSLRRLAQRDLEAATIQGLQGSMRFVLENEELLHPDTLHARNDLLMRRITQQAE